MRFPSAHQIVEKSRNVVLLYPLELLVTFAGTVSASLLVSRQTATEGWLLRIVMLSMLALPSFLAVTLRGRFRKQGRAQRIIEYAVMTALLLLFFFTMHQPPEHKDVIRFVLLLVAAHLLVASAGFIGGGSTAAFWQFNRYLFLRIITAFIFSGALFAGLAGALAAMGALFQLHVDGAWYGRLFIWIIGMFNTMFFLAGVPEDAQSLEEERTYPRVLKVFTQFVLVPLVLIYLVILLAYEGKIIAQWNLPNGWVSNLIIAFGIAGILSILLVHPIRNMEGNRWIMLFSRWFYLLLLPLVVLMFVAIGTRIGHYGFTEERVFVLALAIWLAAIALYYLFRPGGDIRIIPASLALVALLLSVGPVSAFEISKRSQKTRLARLLEKHHLLKDNHAVKAPPDHNIPWEDQMAIRSTIEYLLQTHGKRSVEPYFETGGLNDDRWNRANNATYLMRNINLDRGGNPPGVAAPEQWYGFYAAGQGATITGYDIYVGFGGRFGEAKNKSGVHVRMSHTSFAVYRGAERLSDDIRPQQVMDRLIAKYGPYSQADGVEVLDMQQHLQGRGCKLLVFYERLEGEEAGGKEARQFEGAVFLKWE